MDGFGMAMMSLIAITILMVLSNMNRPDPPKPIPTMNPRFAVKKKRKRKQAISNEIKAAKTMLQSFGFSATEASKMLQGIKASTPEQYVSEAMRKVQV